MENSGAVREVCALYTKKSRLGGRQSARCPNNNVEQFLLRVGSNPIGSSGSHVHERVKKRPNTPETDRKEKRWWNEIAGGAESVNDSSSSGFV
jgi:hypothetical protein